MSTSRMRRIAVWFRRSDWATAAISLLFGCGIALALASCLKVPIGDPEQSRVDPRLNGTWFTANGGVWFFRPWDARTWLVTDVGLLERSQGDCDDPPVPTRGARGSQGGAFPNALAARDIGEFEPPLVWACGAYIHKAWLTTLGGRLFLVLEPAAVVPPPADRAGYRFSEFGWFVYRLDWMDSNHVELHQLDPEFQGLGEVHSREAAEQIIRANIDDSALFPPVEADDDSPPSPIMRAHSVLERASPGWDIQVQTALWVFVGYSK